MGAQLAAALAPPFSSAGVTRIVQQLRRERSNLVAQDPVAGLEAEWTRFGRQQLHAVIGDWQSVDPALHRFACGREIVRFLHGPAAPNEKDDVLRALVRVAPSEPFAARAVLQALLPGLKTLSRRLVRHGRSRGDVWQHLLATAWERIVTYPLERRPRRIAANLLLDTLHAALGQLARERADVLELTERALPAADCDPSGDIDALFARAVALGVVSASDAELVLETRIDGRDLADAAASRGVFYNTAKLRRQRAERRLLLLLGLPPVPRGRQRRHSFLVHSAPVSDAATETGAIGI
jgi:DNA-directed RNA polymerase specialized sigma24 family protein